MRNILLLMFAVLIIPTLGFSQTQNIKIDPHLDCVNNTTICTDFRYYHCIDSSDAKLKNDTLRINFHQETVSTYDDLKISIFHNKFNSEYKTVYFALDSGYNKWIPIKQRLTINSTNWEESKIIKGVLLVEFQEIYIYTNGHEKKTRKIKFSGQFNSKIFK